MTERKKARAPKPKPGGYDAAAERLRRAQEVYRIHPEGTDLSFTYSPHNVPIRVRSMIRDTYDLSLDQWLFARGALDSMLLVPTIDGDWVDRPAGRTPELPAAALEVMRALRGFEPGQTEPAMDQLMNSMALQEPSPIVVRFVADIQSVERLWIERAYRLPLSSRALALGA